MCLTMYWIDNSNSKKIVRCCSQLFNMASFSHFEHTEWHYLLFQTHFKEIFYSMSYISLECVRTLWKWLWLVDGGILFVLSLVSYAQKKTTKNSVYFHLLNQLTATSWWIYIYMHWHNAVSPSFTLSHIVCMYIPN